MYWKRSAYGFNVSKNGYVKVRTWRFDIGVNKRFAHSVFMKENKSQKFSKTLNPSFSSKKGGPFRLTNSNI